jgi:hypothetical protein
MEVSPGPLSVVYEESVAHAGVLACPGAVLCWKACADGQGLALMRLDRSLGALSVRGASLTLSPPSWMAAVWPNSGQVLGSE